MHTKIEIAKSNKTQIEKTDLERRIPPEIVENSPEQPKGKTKRETSERERERERKIKLNGNN